MRSYKVRISGSAIVGLAALFAGSYLLANVGPTSPPVAQAAEPQPAPPLLIAPTSAVMPAGAGAGAAVSPRAQGEPRDDTDYWAQFDARFPARLDDLSNEQRAELRTHLADAFGLNSCQVQSTPRLNVQDELTVRARLGDRVRDLTLHRYSLRSADFTLLVDDGRVNHVEPPPVRTYRGWVVQDPAADVAATIADNGQLHAMILKEGADTWYIEPIAEVIPGAPTDWHVVYRASDVKPTEARCGVDVNLALGARIADRAGETPAGVFRGTAGLTEIAFDADVEFFQLNGSSVPNTTADIEMIANAMDLIYQAQVGICYTITGIIVRTAEPDPYSATDAFGLLCQFTGHWNSTNPIAHDVAHLMTGKDLGATVGVTWLGTICGVIGNFSGVCPGLPNGPADYGLSESLFTTLLSFRVNLTAHEVGHSWNACHCDRVECTGGAADGDCGIMWSSITGSNSFGTRSVNTITAHRDSRACLDTCVPPDCNANGIPDADDIAGGTSQDCNANDFPDECEPNEDCNGNGVQDICDIAGGTSLDCNTNGIPDACDIAGGTSPDSNANGVPDECEPIFEQIDQCAPFIDSYDGSLGFLVDQGFNCNADGTCITGVDDPFVLSGQQHIYFFDRALGDGRLINALDFKYHSSVAGPHVVRVQIRDNVLGTEDAGTLIPGGSYEMALPGSIHLGEADESTSYFVRMVFPSAAAIGCGAEPSYIVGELDFFDSPVDIALDHVLPASIVQTFTSWSPVQSGDDQFTSGVGVSMNAPGTGWFLASEDYFGAGDDSFLLLDKDGENWENAGGTQFGSVFFGGKSCDGPNDGPGGGGGTGAGSVPEGSMYLKLWGESDCNGNDIPDECELDANDCNNNLVPDDCEPTDTDGDMVADVCEECPNEPTLLTPSEPGAELTCNDLIDNDCDGLTDGADPDCGTVCLFTDDFERATGNTVGNGWVESGGSPSAIAIETDGADTYCKMARNNVSITQSAIDTTGLTNISFDYEWRDNGATDAADSLIVQWKPSADGTFITLATHVLTQATFLSVSLDDLPVEAENTTIDIRFLTAVSSVSDGAHVDNVVVCGASLCADSDGDGSCDTDDGCPADPNKTAPGQCGCGNSDTDTDGDGTADCIDGCPIDPNKTAPGDCGCGVVEDPTDTDGDATPDCIDGCPNDPAKTDPGVCGCGTPDTDTDGDGTLDCLDACPNEPALVNPSEPGTELTCNDTVDNDCDGLTDAADPDCTAGCPFTCGDIDGVGGSVNLADFAALALCFGKSGPGGACPDPVTFACSDLDGNGATNLLDFATFTFVFGSSSTNVSPNCP